MTALGFSEHGSVFEWLHKKKAIEAAGMKYLHGIEAYVTETLEEKIRDNYHCVLIAKNYTGFLELNKLVSKSFCRTDNHFYYVPRISLDELFATSENIIISTACIGGILYKGNDECRRKMEEFCAANKKRCFLEIGHHFDEKQVEYNKRLYELSQKLGVRLIAGTDTHVLNDVHEEGRKILQQSKGIHFDNEDSWDLKFHNYDELVEMYRLQGSLPEDIYLEAIKNTNLLADMVEEFTIDRGIKYPHIYENPEETFRKKIEEARAKHPYVNDRYPKDVLDRRINEEFEVYKKTQSIDFMLLEVYMREWEAQNGIECGYGRGSVSGSIIAYILGITQMDSIKFDLNFFRFMNPSRVTNADIDTDYGGKDRDRVKQFLLRDRMNLPQIRTSEIITFNTIAMKGAVRDVCRALYKKADPKDEDNSAYLKIANEICSRVIREDNKDIAPPDLRRDYPEVFKYVDIVNGTVVSIGTHPSGVLVCDLDIDGIIGMCSISTSDYPVSMLNMKELDDMMCVKLDVLGLDNIGVINDTCKSVGISRLTPDNTDLDDENVWNSIRDDTTMIFQWESNSAQAYLKKFMSNATIERAKNRIPNFSRIKWMSFGNGLIRPACASFRDSVAKGEFYDNGFEALNEFLAPEAGRVAMQETIMKFLVKFCGYSSAESDLVRRGIAKKSGTEALIPEIESRFIEYSSDHYGLTKERCEEIIKPFIQVIKDASSYAFSWNHSDPYSITGYICGYLRYYHPLEFLTASLNTFGDNAEKSSEIIKYANKVGIRITSPKFGVSKDEYFYDSENRVIAKGLSSVKYMGKAVARELYDLSQSRKFTSFIDVLRAIHTETTLDSRQLEILIKIDFFSEFGNQRELFAICDIFDFFKQGDAKKIRKDRIDGTQFEEIVRRHATDKTKKGEEAKDYTLLDQMAILRECEKRVLSIGMEDLSIIIKAKNFNEIMGYNYVSGKEEDRPKLCVKAVYPLKRKRDGVQFGYSIVTQSLGSGIESRFTVMNRKYNTNPVKAGDIIICKRWIRDGIYFEMLDYEKLIC